MRLVLFFCWSFVLFFFPCLSRRRDLHSFLHDALPICDIRDLSTCQQACQGVDYVLNQAALGSVPRSLADPLTRSEEHTSELQSRGHLVCRLLLEKKKELDGGCVHVPMAPT